MWNPLLDAFQAANHRDAWPGSPERHELCRRYAWSVPGPEAIDMLTNIGPLVDVMAGTGYWAKVLTEAGADVLAYDLHRPGDSNHFHDSETWFDVNYGFDAAEAAVMNVKRVLFLSWPPYDTTAGYDAVRAYLDAGGEMIAYIGEGWWGCTGDENLHALLDTLDRYDECEVPQWSGIHDCLTIYRNPRFAFTYTRKVEEPRTCILTEADILAGRDDDCTTHDHEG